MTLHKLSDNINFARIITEIAKTSKCKLQFEQGSSVAVGDTVEIIKDSTTIWQGSITEVDKQDDLRAIARDLCQEELNKIRPDKIVTLEIQFYTKLTNLMSCLSVDESNSIALGGYEGGDAHGEGGDAFSGAVLLDDGTVVLVPHISNYVGLYDPSTDTYTRGDAHGERLSAFNGGVLLDDGTVVFIPYNSEYVGLYDPSTDTYTRGDAHGHGHDAFWGGVLLDDGTVVFAPHYDCGNVGLYDPSTDTYTDGDYANSDSYAVPQEFSYAGAVLLDDGTVVLVPHNYDHIGLYDPSTDTFTDGDFYLHSGDFTGGVLLDDGTVVLVPYYSHYVGIYDPSTDTYTRGDTHGEGDSVFNGGVLLDDGTVVLVPYDSNYVGLYDPSTDTYTRGVAHGEGGDAFWGGVLLDDNRVVFAPHNSDNVGILPSYNYSFDGEKPLFQFYCEWADSKNIDWWITKDRKVIFNDHDSFSSGYSLIDLDPHRVKGKELTEQVDKVILKGGFKADGSRAIGTYGSGTNTYIDTYAHIIDEDKLDNYAEQIATKKGINPLLVEVWCKTDSVTGHMLQVGNTINVDASDDIYFTGSQDTVPADDYIIEKVEYHTKTNITHLLLSSGMLVRKERSLPEENAEVIKQVEDETVQNTSDIQGNTSDISTLESGKSDDILPIGTVLMYDGTDIADVSSRTAQIGDNAGDNISMEGWYVCNGNSGTPNLINKFIRGESSSGNTGGNDSPSHSHQVDSHDHTHSHQVDSHDHTHSHQVDSHEHDLTNTEVRFGGSANAEVHNRVSHEEDAYNVPKKLHIGFGGGNVAEWDRNRYTGHNSNEEYLRLESGNTANKAPYTDSDGTNSSPGTDSDGTNSSPGTDSQSPDNKPAYYSVIYIIKMS